MTFLKYVMAFVVIAALTACGGGGGSAGTTSSTASPPLGAASNPVAAAIPAVVEILSSSSTLSSAAGSTVTFFVTVKDANNLAIPGQAVSFSSTSGTLIGAMPIPVTTANGLVGVVSLTPGSDSSNRLITVTATAGNIVKTVSIPVVGTSVSISGAGSALVGTSAKVYSIKAVDSAGKSIVGAKLDITSATGNTVSPPTVTTDSAGTGVFNFTPTVPGMDTLKVSGWGSSAVATVAVSAEDFSFVTPLSAANLVVGTPIPVSVCYKLNGSGVAGGSVTFSSTRGTLGSSLPVLTLSDGCASTTVNSATAGPVTISAQLGTARASLTAAFIATVPASIVLQSNPGAVLPNANGATVNQSTLSATVRDSAGNPVAGKVVNFTALTDGSNGSIVPGSGTTDANGMTSVQFIPGASSTAANGVNIQATVQDNAAIFANSSLTVNGNALFISIGMGSTLTVLNSTTYQKDFSVYVTDSNGAAVTSKAVTISVFPPVYKKGSLVSETSTTTASGATTVRLGWAYSSASPTLCANEDINRDGKLGATEDINGSGSLEPGLPVVISPSNLTTDLNGFASFQMNFGKNYAWWLLTQITARASVSGTESSKTVTYDLEMLAEDAARSGTTPANKISPFGLATVCTDSQ